MFPHVIGLIAINCKILLKINNKKGFVNFENGDLFMDWYEDLILDKHT
jgi:hypothetical protein